MIKKTTLLSIAFGMLFTLPNFAISSNTEIKLLQKALLEGAVTKEQKTAVANFMASIAAEKKKEASSYREMAGLNYGGKARTQDLKREALLKTAKSLEEEAKSYEAMAAQVKSSESEKLANVQ